MVINDPAILDDIDCDAISYFGSLTMRLCGHLPIAGALTGP
jgi:hypothetical protein